MQTTECVVITMDLFESESLDFFKKWTNNQTEPINKTSKSKVKQPCSYSVLNKFIIDLIFGFL